MIYYIQISGCDDSTKFEIELTEKEKEVVNKISELSKNSSQYGCQPVLRILLEEDN